MASPIYVIKSAWPGRSEATLNIGDKFLRTIDVLDGLSENLSNWTLLDKPRDEYLPLTSMLRANFTEFVETQVNRDDYGDPDSENGYLVMAVCDVSQRMDRQQHGCFYASAGSKFRNFSLFEIGSHVAPPDPSLITFPIFKAALLAMISIWPAPWANAQCSFWGERAPTLPGEPEFPYSGYQMPWISYLNAERAANVVVPPEIITERTPDGGLLMIAAETRFDPTNVEHMRPSRLMVQIMDEHADNPVW